MQESTMLFGYGVYYFIVTRVFVATVAQYWHRPRLW